MNCGGGATKERPSLVSQGLAIVPAAMSCLRLVDVNVEISILLRVSVGADLSFRARISVANQLCHLHQPRDEDWTVGASYYCPLLPLYATAPKQQPRLRTDTKLQSMILMRGAPDKAGSWEFRSVNLGIFVSTWNAGKAIEPCSHNRKTCGAWPSPATFQDPRLPTPKERASR